MSKLINIDEYPVNLVLDTLLLDYTTGENIIFATDGHATDSPSMSERDRMTLELLLGFSGVIQPRVNKNVASQAERTRKKAEVFTPTWIIRKMVDCIDDNFSFSGDWQSYVDARCLEITCGEAPFLANRYDAATGEEIVITERTGILDRKLRLLGENTARNRGKWFEGAKRALQSVYGYEFQGDSLLIARINLLVTFVDYMEYYCGVTSTQEQLMEVAEIIARNLWQMDGLTGAIPYATPTEAQLSFSFSGDCETSSDCKIWEWDIGREYLWRDVEGGQGMKFDFVIGNPPYQEETEKLSETNGQLRSKSIFHYFQIEADKISNDGSILIYPAGRWIQRSGKGMSNFGLEQINDKRMKSIYFYPNSKEVFKDAAIADGISIVVKKQKKKSTGFNYIFCENGNEIAVKLDNPGENIIPLNPNDIFIVKKIERIVYKYDFDYMHDRIQSQKLFGIESEFVQKNHAKVREYICDNDVDFTREIKLYANDKAGKSGRTKWFVANRDVIEVNASYIPKWKVVVSSANAGGQKRDNQLEIIDNHSAFGRSRVALSLFDTEEEAHNFYKYVKTYLIRYAFLMTDEALTSLGKKVPDIGDYTSQNAIIDFSKELDKQLFDLFCLSDEEIAYIKNRVDNLRKK